MKNLSNTLNSLSPDRLELLIKTMDSKGISVKELPIFSIQDDSLPPLSYAQERLWIIDQFAPGNSAYHLFVMTKLEGTFCKDAFIYAMDLVIKRHQTLRTTFPSKDGVPYQLVSPSSAAEFEIGDLTNLPEGQRFSTALELASKESKKPFNLAQGPLYRIWLAIISKSEHLLVITFHHIITDNWSMNILLEEIKQGYSAFLEKKELIPTPLEIDYSIFSKWQRRIFSGKEIEEQLNYWKMKLVDAPKYLQIPTDYPRSQNTLNKGERRFFSLDSKISDELKALAQSKDSTNFMALLSAYALILKKLSGMDTIVIGVDVAGRNRPEIERMFGFFVNQLSIIVDLTKPSSFIGLLEQVRKSCLEAYNNQDVPFQKVVEALKHSREQGRTPIFQVKMVYLGFPMTKGPELPGLTSSIILSEATNRFDFELICWEDQNRFDFLLEYASNLFTESTAERLTSSLVRTIELAIHSPHDDLSQLLHEDQVSLKNLPKGIDDDFNF